MDRNTDERQLPFDVDVEQALLGAFLIDASLILKHAEAFDPEMFFDPMHGRIALKIRELWGVGTSQTPLTVGAALENDAGLTQLGGRNYLINLARAAPVMPNVADYCRILRDLSMRRQTIAVGQNLIEMAHSPQGEEATEITRLGAEALCAIGTAGDIRPPRPMSDVAMESLHRVQRALNGEKVPRVITGWSKLDDEIGGFMAGDLIIVPGRPGMGKSAMGAGLAGRVALNGYPVEVFSYEMTESQWADRNLCDIDFDTVFEPLTPIWYESFRKNKLDGPQLERAVRAQQRLSGLNYEICDDDRLTIEDLTARARAFRARFAKDQMGLIVIDYLQKVPVNYRRERTREQEVAHVTKGCKSLAKQLGWPVVALAQLSRDVDKRSEEDRRPTLSDIRESGQIEAEADIVLAPFRPGYYVERKRPGAAAPDEEWGRFNAEYNPVKHIFELLCRKNRHGRTFEVHLWCDIGANAIRDEMPDRVPVSADVGQGLLGYDG